MTEQIQEKNTIDKNTKAVMYYLVQELNGALGKTHLQKLLFLIDLISIKRFGEQTTAMGYKKYHFGPFSDSLETYIDNLIDEGLIEQKKFDFISDQSKHYFRYYQKKKINIKSKLIELIGSNKLVIVDDVINSFGSLSLQDVLDIVYSLEEVKDAKSNDTLIAVNTAHSLNKVPSEDVSDEDVHF